MLQALDAVELESMGPSNTLTTAKSTQGAQLTVRSTSGNLQDGSAILPQDATPESAVLEKGRSIIVIFLLTAVMFMNSMSTGFITVGLPRIAADLDLSENLLLWYIDFHLLLLSLLINWCSSNCL